MSEALRRVSPYIRMAHYFPAGPGWRIAPRVIFDHLLLYTREGAGWLHMQGERWPIASRSLMVIPPGVLHETTHDPASASMMLNIHFDWVEREDSPRVPVNLPTPADTLACTHWMRPAFEGEPALALPPVIDRFSPGVYESAFFTILDAAGSPTPADALRAKGAMTQLLAHLLQGLADPEPVDDISAHALQRLDGLAAHIEERLHEELTIPELAAQCNLSETHFRRAFRARFGAAPTPYIREARLERARRLLLHEQLPIKRIAEVAGFQSIHYFTRSFTARFGVSPARYRSQQGR